MKNEFKVIADLIEKDKRVLDVGCADGTLMKFLKDNKNVLTFASYEDNEELFSDRNVFPKGCIIKMERVNI